MKYSCELLCLAAVIVLVIFLIVAIYQLYKCEKRGQAGKFTPAARRAYFQASGTNRYS